MDFAEAIEALNLKRHKKSQKYMVDVYLGVVKKSPIAPYMDYEWRKLRGTEKGLRIVQQDFLKHDSIAFYQARSGKMRYEVL